MNTERLMIVITAGLAMTACAASPDPAEGGFFNGISGLAGGGYEQRIEERETSLASANQQQSALQARAAELAAQQAEVDRQLASARSRLSSLQSQVADLKRRLAASGESPDSATFKKLLAAEGQISEASARAGRADDPNLPVAQQQAEVEAVGPAHKNGCVR